jgi:lipopolysaccharide export LptBFGC system permease protein LptF
VREWSKQKFYAVFLGLSFLIGLPLAMITGKNYLFGIGAGLVALGFYIASKFGKQIDG